MFRNLNQRYAHRHLVPNNVKQASRSSNILSEFLISLREAGRINIAQRSEGESEGGSARPDKLFTDSRQSRPALLSAKSSVIRSRHMDKQTNGSTDYFNRRS